MTPLEQHVREALTDGVLSAVADLIDTEFYASAQERILTALRPLLEQQAAAVATLTADPEHATCRAVEQRLRRANRRLQAQGDELERDPLIMELRRVVATLMAERDEAREIAVDFLGRMESQSRYVDSGDPARQKIAAWSGETR
jgi:Arc/MetJ-type ribon-helix-helix transcriptional regulator